jgi:cobaltochelatase CobS
MNDFKIGDKIVCMAKKSQYGWNTERQKILDDKIVMTVKDIVKNEKRGTGIITNEYPKIVFHINSMSLYTAEEQWTPQVGDLVEIPTQKSTGDSYCEFIQNIIDKNYNEQYLEITSVDKINIIYGVDIAFSNSFKLQDLKKYTPNLNTINMKTNFKIDDQIEILRYENYPNCPPIECIGKTGAVKEFSQSLIGIKIEGMWCGGKNGLYWFKPEYVSLKGEVKKETPKSGNGKFELNLGDGFLEGLKRSMESAVLDLVSDSSKIIDDKVRKYIKDEIDNIKPIKNFVKIGEGKEVTIDGKLHNKFEETLKLVKTEGQVFLSGAAGSGKTTLGAQIAEALTLSFSHISCSAGMSEAHLLGRMLFDGTYVASEFVNAYENGGVFLFDEVDAADSNTLLVINSALANGKLSVPNRKENPTAKRHKDFVCIAAANTWGNGSNEYHGRNHLDAAFMDRFALSKVFVDYDSALEGEIIGKDNQAFATVLWSIRNEIYSQKLRRILSTRVFVSAAKQLASGRTQKEVLSTFCLGWSDEEKKKLPTLMRSI